MPRGLSKIKQIAAESAARQKAYDEAGPGVRFFSVDDGKTAKARFLEQGEDVWYVWTHQLPKQQGQKFGDSVMCLDQDNENKACPGCSRQVGRSARVLINVIWYGAPKFDREPGKDGNVGKIKKDQSGNPIIIGAEDCVAVWNASQTVGGRLEHLDSKYRDEAGGLTGCVFDVTRQGTDKQTSYMIDLDKIAAPNEQEFALYKTKGDPRAAMRQLSFGDMERAYSGGGVGPNVQAGQAPQEGMENNAFANAASGSAVNRGAFGQ